MKFIGIIKLVNGHNIPVEVFAKDEIEAREAIEKNSDQVTIQQIEEIVCASLNFGINKIDRINR